MLILVHIPESSYHPGCVKAQSDLPIEKVPILKYWRLFRSTNPGALMRRGDRNFRECALGSMSQKSINFGNSSDTPPSSGYLNEKLTSIAYKTHIPRVGRFYFDFSIFDLNLTNFGQYFTNIAAKFANSAEKTINSN